MPITSTQSKHLWDALGWAYDRLGLDVATGGDEVFRQLVLARLVEPTSKLDSMFAYMRPESPLSRAAAVIRPSCGKNWQLRSVKIGTSRRIAQAALADFIAAPTEEPR